MTAHALERLPIDQLRPWPRNVRTHSRKQVRQIAESIRRFGFTNPVLIDGENRILAGHGRVEAARELGMATAPCLRIDHMSATEKRAYVLADNKLALNAGWDEELLALELQELMEADVDFGVDITGFSIAEVDQLIEGLTPSEPGDPADDRLPEPEAVPSRCQPGDLWQLGPHRLICGDALDPRIVADLLDSEKAEMVFTDPPYNVAIDGNVSGLGKVCHREFAMASGEMTRAEFTAFLSSAFANLVSYSLDGSIHFVCMDWRHVGEMLEAGAANYAELKNTIVWVKDNGGMGSFYRSRHELIFAFKNGVADERLKTIIVDEAYRTIKVSEGKRQITIPMAQAIIRALAVNAARGQHRSQQLFAELLSETERANKQQSDEWLQTAIEYKHEWEEELERRERLGVSGPEPLLHPDDIEIDMKTGQVIVKGPMTKEEKVRWDRLRARVEECDLEIKELTASLQDRKNTRFRRFIEDDIAHEKRLRDIIVNAIGEWPKRDGLTHKRQSVKPLRDHRS